jgi:hypothetical protein
MNSPVLSVVIDINDGARAGVAKVAGVYSQFTEFV